MKGPALVIGFGKGDKGAKAPDSSESMVDDAGCDSLLGEAFDALADKDREGFVAAIRAAFAAYSAEGEEE